MVGGGRGTRGGVGRLLITSPNKIRQSKSTRRKEICYLDDGGGKEKRNTSQMYTPTSIIFAFYTYVYLFSYHGVFGAFGELERES